VESVSQLRLAPEDPGNRLYQCIGFDAELEARAFNRLSELDVEGCRAALLELTARLDLSALPDGDGQVVLLLADLLQKVNRRVHRTTTDAKAYHARRCELVERFASCRAADEARAAFAPALNDLLGSLSHENGTPHPLVERAKAYIEQHYHQRVSLSSVAVLLHLSPNYLSRLFRRDTGETLTAYTHKVRLEHAKLLLAEGERSISEVAYAVGYQNYRDFYRNFVKYEKSSPREAQRKLAPPPSR